MRRPSCLQLHSQMFLVLLVSLVLQVFRVSCEEPETTTITDYDLLDYSEFEVIFHGDGNYTVSYEYEEEQMYKSASISSIYPSYFNIVVLLLTVMWLLQHQALPGSTRVRQDART
ncbi:uncharacterized protein ACNLHF_003747 isoform 1-T1 [Anomaloglossus baeobatrachus]